jgi:hypothetical protein
MNATKTTLFEVAFALLFAAACAHTTDTAAVESKEDDPLFDQYQAAYLSNDAALYREARDRHAEYLKKEPSARELRLRYAKLLYALGDDASAAEQLAQVAAGGADHLGRGAARNVIVVLHEARAGQSKGELKALRDRGRIDRATLNFETAPIELPDYSAGDIPKRAIPALEKSLADACDKYLELSDGQDTALPTFRLMSAQIYLRHGHAIEGAERCADVVTRWPQTDVAESCVHVIVDALNSRREWKELEKHVRSFRNNLSLIGADHLLEQQLEQVLQVATFNRIQSTAEPKTPREPAVERRALIKGAEEMRAFQREFPYSESGDEALYNAFVYYARAEKRTEAIAAAQALIAIYSSSPLVREVHAGLKKLNFVLSAETSRL